MKVLLSVLHFGFLRNFESVVLDLAARGHDVLMTADEPEDLGGQGLAEHLAAQSPRVQWRCTPSYESEAWFDVARKLRTGGDYLRFLDPSYEPYPKLRDRAAERAPRLITSVLRLPTVASSPGRGLLNRVIRAIDGAMPRSSAMDRFLAEHRPDVALFASVTNPRSPQLDHLRSARALGIPSGVCVYSWDHLSSKALIRVAPDRVFVWNDVQKREAVNLHGLPADSVVVTGAQVYDQWFTRQPSRSRAAFAAAVGVPADRALILYVCSALSPDPGEATFVHDWIATIRQSSDQRVRDAAVLIRPHPERRREWQNVAWPDLGPVVVAGANPVSADAKADYFDALHYSAAVVGLVTSAFLEAAIAGAPVLTITPPHLRAHQEGMLHFRYLLEVEGGLLTVAPDLPAHVTQLEQILGGDRSHLARQNAFLRAFVRPAGLDVAATPIFGTAVEELARAPRRSEAARVSRWRQFVARRIVASADGGVLAPLFRDAREQREHSVRNASVRAHRRDRQDKWRQHRRRKLLARVQWKWKRVRDLVRPATPGRHD